MALKLAGFVKKNKFLVEFYHFHISLRIPEPKMCLLDKDGRVFYDWSGLPDWLNVSRKLNKK